MKLQENYMVKIEPSRNSSHLPLGSPVPKEKNPVTEVSKEAMQIELIPEIRVHRPSRFRILMTGLADLIQRIRSLFSRVSSEELNQELSVNLSEEGRKRIESLLHDVEQEMEKSFKAESESDELSKLENKEIGIKGLQRLMVRFRREVALMPANDPLKAECDRVLKMLVEKFSDMESYFSDLEEKYGDETTRLVKKWMNDEQFQSEFQEVVEILLDDSLQVDVKLPIYEEKFVTIIREMMKKSNPGADEVYLFLISGFQWLKRDHSETFDRLAQWIKSSENQAIINEEDNDALMGLLFPLQNAIQYVQEDKL